MNNINKSVLLCALFSSFQGIQADRACMKVEVSYGEFVDKLTILEIKKERIANEDKKRNISNELAILQNHYNELCKDCDCKETLEEYKDELKLINETLWEIEDDIREKEAKQEFDEEFKVLARSVYVYNDLRGDVKRKINLLLRSSLIEEKQYTRYDKTGITI